MKARKIKICKNISLLPKTNVWTYNQFRNVRFGRIVGYELKMLVIDRFYLSRFNSFLENNCKQVSIESRYSLFTFQAVLMNQKFWNNQSIRIFSLKYP